MPPTTPAPCSLAIKNNCARKAGGYWEKPTGCPLLFHWNTPIPFLYSNLDKLNQHGLHPYVEITTNKGSFVIRRDGYYAPYTTAAFLDLIDSGFYCGLIFHRVVPNFVVRGGDPRGDGWGGPNYHLLTEKSPIGYNTGSVGIASSGPDTEGSQFFITTTPQYYLDYNYTRFGEIVEGLNVVFEIKRGDQILSAQILRSSN
jgi:peptidyl-prolyl cis-trans isomerase B (cyclophilin B)